MGGRQAKGSRIRGLEGSRVPVRGWARVLDARRQSNREYGVLSGESRQVSSLNDGLQQGPHIEDGLKR